VSQPTIVNPEEGRDDAGRVWVQALVDAKSRVLAGRDAMLNFHLFVSPEELFDNALATIYSAKGIKLDDIVAEATTKNGEPA